MKKYLALLLALATVFALVACGKMKTPATEPAATEPSATDPATGKPVELPATALALLESVWNAYGEDQKFLSMGGNYDEDETKNNNVDNAPGKYALDNDGMTTVLMVPSEKLGDIAEAASLMHGMMANNFTSGAYKLKSGVDAKAFGEAMHSSIVSQRFLCGAPEAVLVVVIEDYVIATYGLKELLDVQSAKITSLYPNAQVLHNELITE